MSGRKICSSCLPVPCGKGTNRTYTSRLNFRLPRRVALAAAILVSVAATLAGGEWSEIDSGLPRTIPDIRSLAIDLATPSTLYAVDNNGRLFKSHDSGESWKVRGSLSGVRFVVVDPTSSSIIYAATRRGVLKSTDGGENWAGADSGLGHNYVWIIAIDPLTPATLYAAASTGIFKSTDAARSWNKLDTLPPEAYVLPNVPYFEGGLTIDPVAPSTIYVDFRANFSVQGILKSADGGQSWNSLYNAPGISLYSLVVDPITSSILYATSSKADGNILKSTDGGQTWTVHPIAPPGASVRSLAIDPISPSNVYAVYRANSLDWGILKSIDSGENWSTLDTGLPPKAAGTPLLAVTPTMPATVYTGYFDIQPPGHLAKSMDGGVTWNAADAGLNYIDVQTVAIDPAIPFNIYAGMGGTGSSIPLFKSADGGASWTSLAQFQLGGSDWYGWISFLLLGSASPNSIYTAANSADGYHAVFKSKDGGANWIRSGPAPFGALNATAMTLDAADSNTIYLGYYDPYGDGEAILYKSVDGGSTWPESYEWDIGPVNALVIDPSNRTMLYAGTPEGVFQSADGGAIWSNLGLSMGVTSLALDPGDPNTIYAAAGNFGAGFLGLFKSTDGGATWTPINSGLARVLDSRSTVNALAMAPYNRGTLYAATSGRGGAGTVQRHSINRGGGLSSSTVSRNGTCN